MEPIDIAEVLLGELNQDLRPNPSFPALSIGDTVFYQSGDDEAKALAVETVGWRAVSPPPAPTDDERAAYRRKLDNWLLQPDGDVAVVVHDEPYDESPRLWDDGADDERSIP